MPRTYLTQLINREAQTSDTGVWREDLKGDVGISALDLGIRLTNGSTSAVNKDILDVCKKIIVQFNGAEDRFKLTGQELFRHNWMKFGAAMPYNFDQSGSANQEVWFRIMFGRYVGDPLYGLDLRRFNNVQIQCDSGVSLHQGRDLLVGGLVICFGADGADIHLDFQGHSGHTNRLSQRTRMAGPQVRPNSI